MIQMYIKIGQCDATKLLIKLHLSSITWLSFDSELNPNYMSPFYKTFLSYNAHKTQIVLR